MCWRDGKNILKNTDDGVDIDLPSHKGIEGALKYMKNNKAAGAAAYDI
jgi:hypothetical protein